MSLSTREFATWGRADPPYSGRAFVSTTQLPHMGKGGQSGVERMVRTENQVTFPYSDHVRNSAGGGGEYEQSLMFTPLLVNWQQADYRPLMYTDSTRNAIKDMHKYSPHDPSLLYLQGQVRYANEDQGRSITAAFDEHSARGLVGMYA